MNTATHPSRSRRRALRNRALLLAAAAVVTTVGSTAIFSVVSATSPSAAAPRTVSAAHGALEASDEFNGRAGTSPNSTIWTALQGGGGWGNKELQSYTNRTSNVSLNGQGDLAITARKETYTGSDGKTEQYTSARLISQTSVQYAYVEARILLPQGQGLWPAFWTIGSDVYNGVPWPYTGEIDIMEAYNQMLSVWGTVHGPRGSGTSAGAYALPKKYTPSYSLGGSWHTYGVNWTATSITWYLDGVAYYTLNKASMPAGDTWEFSKPQRLQLNLAVGGTGPGAPAATTVFPATMLVDYVRVYSNS